MPTFRYRALTRGGEVVSGSIAAPTAMEVSHRVAYLGLVPIDAALAEPAAKAIHLKWWSRPRADDVTVFTRDLALLLKAGIRINDGLELLAQDSDLGRLRSVVAQICSAVNAGESFGEALSHHSSLFSAMYVALVRVGESSGTLPHLLEVLAAERMRAEAMRRQLADALRYPSFVLLAACSVLIFFLLFVLPQFGAILRDFNAKLDPVVVVFLTLSDLLRQHGSVLLGFCSALATGGMLALRTPRLRARAIALGARAPVIRSMLMFHRTALFCRNLGVLLGNGVAVARSLRILADMMTATGGAGIWRDTVDRVRHGRKISDALGETAALPAMAIRMLRLGEETGELPLLAQRVAEFYETKLQRGLDRMVGVAGPLAIIIISIVVGGLIMSVMTALLSVSQIVG
jgi:general secretion pathway protein F